jgi:hypothetical protein
MTKEEKKTVYQAVILLEVLRKETKKDYLKNEAERLIRKLERHLES